jgi:MerR family transcriptional regulator/heat shock protein HspR
MNTIDRITKECTPQYPIRDIAKKFDLSNTAHRKYECAGLLLPYRKELKHRLYSNEDLCRIDTVIQSIRIERLNLKGIRRLLSLLSCWELKPCTFSNRAKCPAYREYENPYWMIEETLCRKIDRDCRDCHVNRDAF